MIVSTKVVVIASVVVVELIATVAALVAITPVLATSGAEAIVSITTIVGLVVSSEHAVASLISVEATTHSLFLGVSAEGLLDLLKGAFLDCLVCESGQLVGHLFLYVLIHASLGSGCFLQEVFSNLVALSLVSARAVLFISALILEVRKQVGLEEAASIASSIGESLFADGLDDCLVGSLQSSLLELLGVEVLGT